MLARYEWPLTMLGASGIAAWALVSAPEWLYDKAGHLLDRIWTDPGGFASMLGVVAGAIVGAVGVVRVAWKRDPSGSAR